jgi:hypothetical protein
MVNLKILERDIKFYNVKANNFLNKTILDPIVDKEKKSLLIEREKLEVKILDSKCGVNPNSLLTDIRAKRKINASDVVINIIGGK